MLFSASIDFVNISTWPT